MLKAYDTWLTRLNQDRTSVMFFGVVNAGISLKVGRSLVLSQIQQTLWYLPKIQISEESERNFLQGNRPIAERHLHI